MKTLTALVVSLGFTGLLSAQTLSNYQFTVTSQNPSAYFKLDGTLEDSITPSQVLAISGLTGAFFYDAFRNSTNAYAFFAPPDALIVPSDVINGGGPGTNDAATGTGSLSFMFRTIGAPTTTGQRWLFSQGDSSVDGNALGLFFENSTNLNGPADLKLRIGNGTVSLLPSNSIAFSSWYHFALTWDESRNSGEVIWYLGKAGGTLSSGVINLNDGAVVGTNGNFVIGNAEDLNSAFRDIGNAAGRMDEVAFWNRELTATEVTNQFTKMPSYTYAPAATYQDVLAAQHPAYYFKLDNSLVDSIGGFSLGANGAGGTFTTNVLGVPNSAYEFNNSDDALVATNDLNAGGGSGPNPVTTGLGGNNAGTMTFLFRMLAGTNNTGQRWLLSQGTNNSGTRNALNIFLENTNINNGDPNNLKLRWGNTTTTVTTNTLVSNAWYYFAITYDESRNNDEIHWYLGRVGDVLLSGIFNPANDAVFGDNGLVYFGNRVGFNLGFRNPGAGAIDEFATWNGELQLEEIQAQFASITNGAAVPAPSLQISLVPPDVILSWPNTTPSSYQLEATPALVIPTTWTNAGSPTTVGSSYVVTNPITPSAQFFRLHKP